MADDDLLLVPPVPDALREAAQVAGNLIPFIGAGASRLAGCPSWIELADAAFNCFVDQGKFSHAQLDQIKSLNPRVKLSLAVGMQDELRITIDFKKLIHPVERQDHANGRRLYGILAKLGRTFVTTNCDEWLDEVLPEPSLSVHGVADGRVGAVPKRRDVFVDREELTAANLNREGAVLHLHGSVRKPEGMIITTRHYVKHYENDRRLKTTDAENPVLTFLEFLFRTKTVLFIGYGLEELEILEYVILKTRDLKTPNAQPRHFILQGYFSHQRELMLSMRRYYRDCGIELLPFLMDPRGHEQLIEVLDAFARTVPPSTLAVLQEFEEMETLLNG
ncbi:MAG TPA: SIR2 family protein [Thermoanaerobaculia bacterium]|nr:SIR2 family protein [Thermoanaerobaculia bacterium]